MMYILRTFHGKKEDETVEEEIEVSERSSVPCVLCGTMLLKGEKLKSKEFKGRDDSIIHIMGCHQCHGEKALSQKTCPVCNRILPPEGYLIGRMWKKKNGKLHLHVNGCIYCRKGGSR